MAEIIPHERAWQSIRLHPTDRVSCHFSCTIPTRLKLENYFGTIDLINEVGRRGGLMLDSSHNRPGDNPPENLLLSPWRFGGRHETGAVSRDIIRIL